LHNWALLSTSIARLEVNIVRAQREVCDHHIRFFNLSKDLLRYFVVTFHLIYPDYIDWKLRIRDGSLDRAIIVLQRRLFLSAKRHRHEQSAARRYLGNST